MRCEKYDSSKSFAKQERKRENEKKERIITFCCVDTMWKMLANNFAH